MKFEQIYSTCFDGWGFSFRRSQIFRYKKYIKLLSKATKGKKIEKILDIGCSTGFFTCEFLKKTFNQAHINAIDVSQIAISRAKIKYRNKTLNY